jgi:hypothetical protein
LDCGELLDKTQDKDRLQKDKYGILRCPNCGSIMSDCPSLEILVDSYFYNFKLHKNIDAVTKALDVLHKQLHS